MTVRWNQAKLEAMREESRAQNLHVRDLGARVQAARQILVSIQRSIDKYGPVRNGVGRMVDTHAPPQILAEVAEQQAKVAELQALYQRAEDAWNEHGGIVRRCEEYAREHLGYRDKS